jgi:hypothetical protein
MLMSKQEMDGFELLMPMVSTSLNGRESNMIAELLGYKNVRELATSGFPNNHFLRNAYSILSFLYLSRDDPFTFGDFWGRLLFTDKDVERRVRTSFGIRDEGESLSTAQLELMYLLETDRDELDGRDLGC